MADLQATDLIDALVQSCTGGRTESFNHETTLNLGARAPAGPCGPLDPGGQPLVRPARRNARVRRRRPGPGCPASLGTALLSCIGDSGPRPAAGCASEHLGEPAFR